MKLIEICNKLLSSEIKIKSEIGHCFNPIVEEIESYYEWMKECSEDEKEDDKYRGIFLNIINKDYEIGQVFVRPSYFEGFYCFDCGEYFIPYLIDELTIGLINKREYSRKINENNYKPFLCSAEETLPCIMLEDKKKGFLTSEIEIPSGHLLFKNYFKDERIYNFPKDINQYDAEHSINSIRGRKNLMQHLSTMNVGYGQMGNMCVSIFVKNDGTEIIIGTDYSYNEKDGEIEVKHKGFINLGKISLSVWRWMCADIEVLKLYNEPIEESTLKLIEKFNSCDTLKQQCSSKYKDEILVNVKPGKWVIEHYYEFQTSRRELIYSKMYLK